MSRKKIKIDTFIQNERNFTLIRCNKCGEFYDKHGRRHVCRTDNSMSLSGRMIPEEPEREPEKK